MKSAWIAAGVYCLAMLALSTFWGVRGASETIPPNQAGFTRTVLVPALAEPVDLDVVDDGSVLVAERRGRLLHWREGDGAIDIGTLPLFVSKPGPSEFGLLAVAADPKFARNKLIYVMYVPPSDGRPMQRVSRFALDSAGRIDMTSEKSLIEIPSDDNCCHTGGAIRFDGQGLLYIATGDNTNPWVDEGYNPADNRPDREGFDALRSAGNTMDLRGKILRIRPTTEGGYEIPRGNLFTDPAVGRPEIYVMGARNPYTMSIDRRTGALYYGDVGPDGRADSPTRGSRGYDEVNRITAASNMGWPLFIGDNFPYHAFDYAKGEAGAAFDPAHPVNASPRNTGARDLPPARPALIYYPYAASETWPLLGEGGRNALVAGVYRRPRGADNETALPRYYDGKLIISDFMRRWMMAVTIGPDGQVASIEPFAPQIELVAPLDYDFGPDGALYVVEYGSVWFEANPDSALSRITFSRSAARAADKAGQAPMAAVAAGSGAALVERYGCLSCHQIDQASIGPAYRDVAARYGDRADAQAYLSARIASGGSGVWGEQAMASFDFIPEDERATLADYILSQRPHAEN